MIYISHLLEDGEMKQLLQNTQLGIESIEFSVAENLDNFSQTLAAYKKRLDFIGCKELTLHGPFLDLNPMAYDSLIAQITRQRYEQAYQAAKKLGAKKLILHSGFLPSVYLLIGWADRMADFYNHFLEDKDDSIQILMENVMDPLPSPLLDVARKVSHPAFGLCLDVGHANCFSKVPVNEWANMLFPYVRHLHLHDNPGDKDRHLALGSGSVPVEQILSLFSEQKQVSCTIECSSPGDVLTSLDVLRKAGCFH